MITVPEPIFIEQDLDKIVAENIAIWERVTGKVLHPAQVERAFIDLIAYREYLIRQGIQEAAKKNLLAYATYPVIDYLGEIHGVLRLAAIPATTQLQISLDEAQAADIIIPSGWRVETTDGNVQFLTDEAVIIPAGEISRTVWATAKTAGALGNGYLPGTVSVILDPLPHVVEVVNLDTTSLGADTETDDQFRERIRLAPEKYSTAGSRESYRFWALSAHPDVLDIEVKRTAPGYLDVYVLSKSGIPTDSLVETVRNAISGDRVRPLTDEVNTTRPTSLDFTVHIAVTLFSGADIPSTLQLIETTLDTYSLEMRSKLGRDIVPAQLYSRLTAVEGVYNCDLTITIGTEEYKVPQTRVLDRNEFGNLVRLPNDITITGTANG